MPSACATGWRSSPGARCRSPGLVDEARDRLRPQVRLETRGRWPVARRAAPEARHEGPSGISPCPKAASSRAARADRGEAGILSLSIERPGLHDAFVAIAGEAAARASPKMPRKPKRPSDDPKSCAPPPSSPAAISSR
jgi:ABC-2 type transport system ATP-binding protein